MIGVVADDITGANDIGIMFRKKHLKTIVISFQAMEQCPTADVVVIDTNSRMSPPEVAYERTRKATRRLAELGSHIIFGKVCSVFRGNIGRTFDAILDEIGETFAPIILGFPKNGRTTICGVHYVRGVPLEQSEFANDPIHPMGDSSLESILQKQTSRKVSTLHWNTVDKGAGAIQERLNELRNKAQYVVFDVRSQHDLKIIAEAVHGYRVLCGSSALAEELPDVLNICTTLQEENVPYLPNAGGILIIAGSLMPQTKRQIEHLRNTGVECFEVDTVHLFERPAHWELMMNCLVNQVSHKLNQNATVAVFASNSEESVRITLDHGARNGLTELEIRQRVSNELASLAERVMSISGCRRTIVAGGETSACVCNQLKVHAFEIISEIAPGLPLSLALHPPKAAFVLKSGSFGADDFFLRAIQKFKSLSNQ